MPYLIYPRYYDQILKIPRHTRGYLYICSEPKKVSYDGYITEKDIKIHYEPLTFSNFLKFETSTQEWSNSYKKFISGILKYLAKGEINA